MKLSITEGGAEANILSAFWGPFAKNSICCEPCVCVSSSVKYLTCNIWLIGKTVFWKRCFLLLLKSVEVVRGRPIIILVA